MENIEYHLATEADIDTILECRIMFSDELVGKQAVEGEKQMRAQLRQYFKAEVNKNYLCWYATVDGQVASIAGLVVRSGPGNVKNPSGKWGYIMSVYTLPQFRRRSLSSNILNKLLETAMERGITAFELHATEVGEPVYIKNGFKLHNEPTYRKFVTPAEQGVPAAAV